MSTTRPDLRPLHTRAAFVILSASLTAAPARADRPAVGDPAPPLGPTTVWLQGEPALAWAPGRVYVLDFWATWCGPCLGAMPRIDAMAREHAGSIVTVIGVATLPQEGMRPTREFLASRPEPLAYAIAEDPDNRLAALYDVLNLGLPTVAIVDAQGRLAWIATGSDAPVEETLRAILAGEYDLTAAAEADRRLLALRAEGDRLLAAARALFNEGRIDESVPIYEQVIALDPREYGYVAGRVFTKLRNAGRADLALSLGRRALAGPIASEPDALEGLADEAMSGEAPSHDEIALALAAAARAGELTQWREPDAWSLTARAHFLAGRHADAVRAQRECIRLCEALGADEESLRSLTAVLAQYEKAAGSGSPR